MQISKLFALAVPVLFVLVCNVSINNTWQVPNTELEISVEKQKPSALRDEVERRIILRDKHLEKTNIKLAKGMNAYSRINIYQIGESEYVLKDVFETYILNAQSKSLTKTDSGILSMTYKENFPKFIGAFDDNESGGWRYIPASERGEIPLTTLNKN